MTVPEKNNYDLFFIHCCAIILLLRLCLPVVLGDDYVYISENLCDLIAAGLIFILSFLLILKKILNAEAVLKSKLDVPILLTLTAVILPLFHPACISVVLNSVLIFISYIFLFYILYDALKSRDGLNVLWRYFMLSGLLVAVVALWEFLFMNHPLSFEMRRVPQGVTQSVHFGLLIRRIASLYDWPNILAGYLMLMIPLAWAGSILVQELWQKRILAFLIFIFLIVFFLTYSLMACVGFFFVSLFIIPLILKEFQQAKSNRFSFWMVGASLLLFLMMILFIRKNFDTTARVEYLRLAFHLIKDNPWFGTGGGTFSIVSTRYIKYIYGFSSYVHNSYLQLWVENGILGFIAVLSLVAIFAITAFKAYTNETHQSNRIILIGFIWAISAFLIDNLSNFTMLRPNVAYFWWAILAAFFGFARFINTNNNPSTRGKWEKPGVLLIISLVVLAVLLFAVIRIALALLSYQQGVKSFNKQDIESAAFSFYASKQLDPIEFNYPMALGSIYLRIYSLGHDARNLDSAEDEYDQALLLAPESHKIYFILSNITAEKKDYIKAGQFLKQAIRLCPIAYKKIALPK